MDENNQFSGIPGLGDTDGLNQYIQDENLKSMGINDDGNAQTPNPNVTPGQDNGGAAPAQQVAQGQQEISKEYFDKVNAELAAANKELAAYRAQQAAAQQAQQGYTPNVKAFINEALARGYSLQQIQAVLSRNNGMNQVNQRISNLEEQIRAQQYAEYEQKFVNKMNAFGEKWGLNENDLVLFGEAALKQGINIANDVNLEAVFRAIYPEQYAIRAKRMAPTATSQLYGGSSMPETNKMRTSRYEDAYVESFLKQTMPGQYNQFNKK